MDGDAAADLLPEPERKSDRTTTPPFAGRILFVTGRQGAGKSAVANELAAAHGFAHLGGDLWSRQPEVKGLLAALCGFMVKYRGAEPGSVLDEPEAWQPFYAAMCAEAVKLGDACTFLVMDPPPALALERAARRCAEQYAAVMKKSVDEWASMLKMNSAGFQDYEPEVEEEVDALVLKNDGTEQSVSELLVSAEALLDL